MREQISEEKVFKDPVHDYVYVQDQTIWDLINTREFQRLRRIRQLGTTYLTFHGAEHSRFSHSLGVYEITRKIISQFERNRYPDWPLEERLVSLCAALLHDVGHGPFSHSLEEIFDTDHEEWTCAILLGETEINEVLRRVSDEFPLMVSSVIKKTYPKPIVVSLISSQMDADRMDYLLRDAYFTGVNYGTFDLERILRVLRPYKGQIVVKESGMHAVEHYLMSRYQMYWQIYFHPVTRSSEIILRQIFRRAAELNNQGYRFRWMTNSLKKLLSNTLSLQDYLKLDEAHVQTAFSEWSDETDELLSDLCRRFINRYLYKYVTIENPDETLLAEVADSLLSIGLNPDYHMEIDYPFDLPYDVYRPEQKNGEKSGKAPILLLDSEDEISEISVKSDIVRSITGLHQGQYHLYFPEEPLLKNKKKLPEKMIKLFKLD
ncbi:HD domain-containing protein [Paenibacillus sp. GSMTC-2017]|uniref:HD domain-containing protein n=1 Tax=Paenibacillus sp. GSMTC-2017 TaxID=2794350 RepID=UPI0018D8607F|nr:HD domain-containing protein [Paenibacillus sp. GSMTC-2017]MBH5320737.1 HD domain-containing protein [Paenibacillus sp. GSMTC-2017]